MPEIREVWMPYGMVQLEDGTWRLFNRSYAPMGEPIKFARKLSEATLAAISAPVKERREGMLWFYNDGCVPTDSDVNWKAYSDRLKALAKLQVKA